MSNLFVVLEFGGFLAAFAGPVEATQGGTAPKFRGDHGKVLSVDTAGLAFVDRNYSGRPE